MRCSRCGEETPTYWFSRFEFRNMLQRPEVTYKEFVLCPEHFKQFNEWVKGEIQFATAV